jgi:FMN phosphatase YigB (HAD superfamily)
MTNNLSPGSVDALLFDIGRVVIDVDFTRVVDRWAEHARCPPQNLTTRFSPDEAYNQHEIGALDASGYFASLRRKLRIDISDEAFLEGWNAIFGDEMPGIADHLARASKHLPLYAFSNTNAAHIAHFTPRYQPVLSHFKTVFLSSSIGLRKPDAAAYDHVIAQIGAPASRIVFFDDSAENIKGAESRGLIGVQVTSSADVERTFIALGL